LDDGASGLKEEAVGAVGEKSPQKKKRRTEPQEYDITSRDLRKEGTVIYQ
jgi:hypothetical protein